MKGTAIIIALAVGIALGVGGALYAPDYVKSYLPQPASSSANAIDGKVVAKGMESDRLLLTILTPEGATLVTFTKRIPEINLLVAEGDTVTLGLRQYRPFISNPSIKRVRKLEAPISSAEQAPAQEVQKPEAAKAEAPKADAVKLPPKEEKPAKPEVSPSGAPPAPAKQEEEKK